MKLRDIDRNVEDVRTPLVYELFGYAPTKWELHRYNLKKWHSKHEKSCTCEHCHNKMRV